MNDFLPLDGSVLVVDDQIDEAMCLIQLLSSKGIASTFYRGIERSKLPTVPTQKIRLAFFDIQLLPGRTSHEYAQIILGLVERLIPPDNGPYAVVLWSNRIEVHAAEVKEQLLSNANALPPLCVIELRKGDYFVERLNEEGRDAIAQEIRDDLAPSFKLEDLDRIATALGDKLPLERYWEPKSETSLTDILAKLKSELASNGAGFELFTRWEAQVHKAASQTVRSYADLHSDKAHWPENIKYVIYRMAQAQAGKNISTLDKAGFMENALRTLNQTFLDDVENNVGSLSNLAISAEIDIESLSFTTTFKSVAYKLKWHPERQKYHFYKGEALIPQGNAGFKNLKDLEEKVKTAFRGMVPVDEDGIKAVEKVVKVYGSIKPEINSKLHVDSNPVNALRPSHVYKKNVRRISRRKELLANYFQAKDSPKSLIKLDGSFALDDVKLREIIFIELEVTPPCDFAQDKWRKSRVLPGILIPEEHYEQFPPDKDAEGVYAEMPVVKVLGANYKPLFDFRLFKSADKDVMVKLGPPLFRLRQEIHSDIISKLSNHVNRLGIAFLA